MIDLVNHLKLTTKQKYFTKSVYCEVLAPQKIFFENLLIKQRVIKN